MGRTASPSSQALRRAAVKSGPPARSRAMRRTMPRACHAVTTCRWSTGFGLAGPGRPDSCAVEMRIWLAGARPRTLPASVVPVAVGTACAVDRVDGGLVWWRAIAAAIVALALQIATNYANDYSDGVRGTDSD